jgi:RNA polymerase sigma factor (sigma-70 family)
MKKERFLTQEDFDRLLVWLATDRELAAQKYEEVRRRLIKIFVCRGCLEAEDLADDTINRVAGKVQTIAETYTGDPAVYFYGVAHKIHLEYISRTRARLSSSPPPPPRPEPDSDKKEQDYECLERCMQQLTPNNRELVLQYYQQDKRAKIDNRKLLAQQLSIALNALRIRAHRIRTVLQQCVSDCMERASE